MASVKHSTKAASAYRRAPSSVVMLGLCATSLACRLGQCPDLTDLPPCEHPLAELGVVFPGANDALPSGSVFELDYLSSNGVQIQCVVINLDEPDRDAYCTPDDVPFHLGGNEGHNFVSLLGPWYEGLKPDWADVQMRIDGVEIFNERIEPVVGDGIVTPQNSETSDTQCPYRDCTNSKFTASIEGL